MPACMRAASLYIEAVSARRATTRRVLFLVHRAADGWVALDLTGEVTDSIDCAGRGRRGTSVGIRRGGDDYFDRVFTLHALRGSAFAGSLPIHRAPKRGENAHGDRFSFGGDLERLLTCAEELSVERLILFRGLTVLDAHCEEGMRDATCVPATCELVFGTPPARLHQRVIESARRACAPGGRRRVELLRSTQRKALRES